MSKNKGLTVLALSLQGDFTTQKKEGGANVAQWPNDRGKLVSFPNNK